MPVRSSSERSGPRRASGARCDRRAVRAVALESDWDDLTLVRLHAERASSSARHGSAAPGSTSTIEPIPGGCVLRDRVRFEPRLPVPARALLPLYRTVFRHRHRRLRRPVRGTPRIGGVIATADYELLTEAAGLVDRSDRAVLELTGRRERRVPPGPGDERRGGARARAAAATRRCSTTRASSAPTCACCAGEDWVWSTRARRRRGAAAQRSRRTAWAATSRSRT